METTMKKQMSLLAMMAFCALCFAVGSNSDNSAALTNASSKPNLVSKTVPASNKADAIVISGKVYDENAIRELLDKISDDSRETSETKRFIDENSKQTQEKEMLKNELSRLRAENEALRGQINPNDKLDLDDLRSQYNKNIAALEKKHQAELNQKATELSEQRTYYQRELKKRKTDYDDIVVQLEDAKRKLNETNGSNSAALQLAQAEYKSLESRFEKANAEITAQNKKITELEQENRRLLEQEKRRPTETTDAADVESKVNAAVKSATLQLEKIMNSELTYLRTQLMQAKEELNAAQKKNNSNTASELPDGNANENIILSEIEGNIRKYGNQKGVPDVAEYCAGDMRRTSSKSLQNSIKALYKAYASGRGDIFYRQFTNVLKSRHDIEIE